MLYCGAVEAYFDLVAELEQDGIIVVAQSVEAIEAMEDLRYLVDGNADYGFQFIDNGLLAAEGAGEGDRGGEKVFSNSCRSSLAKGSTSA